jgi:hypothetical protein
MDLLLSLPIASYFFSSSLTSWSTSLNLVFFYMTWSTLVLSHSPLKLEILGVTAARVVLWLAPSLLFLAFDTLVPSLAEGIKYNGASALPPRDARSLAQLTGLALFNLALETAVEAGLSLGLTIFLQAPVFRTSTTLPLPWQILKHLALLFTAREILTYAIHRYLLHGQQAPSINTRRKSQTRKPPSTTLTNLHTNYAHSRAAPAFSLLVRTDHPLPYLLHHFLPLYLPAIALHYHPDQLHILTYILFVALATLEETLSMSGYAVMPGILMGGMTRRCAVHYATAGKGGSNKKVGNFGSWGVLDWVCGTSRGGDVMADLREEAEKHQVKERGTSKIGGLTEGVANGLKGASRRKSRKGSE